MRERCADECLFHWAAVQRAATGKWAQGFAAEIELRARKPWWRPTTKQLTIMRRMVDELFYGADGEVLEAPKALRGIEAVREIMSRPETVSLPPEMQLHRGGTRATA